MQSTSSQKIRWVPEWMTSADNQKQLAAKSELSLATSQNDTDVDAGDRHRP